MKVTIKPITLEEKEGIYSYQTDETYPERYIIAPHSGENRNSLELLKFKLWAEKQRRGITCLGCLNQVPLFSQFCNRMVLRDKPDCLNESYTCHLSDYHIDRTVPKGERGWWMDIDIKPENAWDIKTIPPFHRMLTENVADEKVLERYTEPVVWIRRETWELFKKLKLPKDIFMCEIKPASDGGKIREILDHNRDMFKLPLKGVTWEDQRELLNATGHQHYMGVQLLASLYNNWNFICYGGSSNLFSLLPVRVVHLSSSHMGPQRPLIRALSIARWGELGKNVPTFGQPILDQVSDFAYYANEFVDKAKVSVEVV
jgi:hypothetical protein